MRFETPVTRLAVAAGGDGAVAYTDSGPFEAPVIAVAAGAWIAPLLDVLGEIIVGLATGDAAAEPRFTLAAHRANQRFL